jgi:hypothetical protein
MIRAAVAGALALAAIAVLLLALTGRSEEGPRRFQARQTSPASISGLLKKGIVVSKK